MKEIIKSYSPASDAPLHIHMAGVSYCDGSYRIYRKKSQVTVIEYILSGTGFIRIDNREITVGPDHIYILPRGIEHLYYSSAEEPWVKIFINVGGAFSTELLARYGIENRYLFDGTGMKDLFLRIEDIVLEQSTDETVLSAIYFEAVARLSRLCKRADHSEEAIRLKDYIDNNPERLIANRELAGIIYRSPDYCVKLFGREYNITPYEYQLREKMQLACRLLRDTALPIADIAARVGYHDPCYFSGLFKRKCGCAPKEYRNRNVL